MPVYGVIHAERYRHQYEYFAPAEMSLNKSNKKTASTVVHCMNERKTNNNSSRINKQSINTNAIMYVA